METSKTYSIAGFKVRMAGEAMLRALDAIPGFGEFVSEDGVSSTSPLSPPPDIELNMDGIFAPGTFSGSRPMSAYTIGELVHNLSPGRGEGEGGWLFETRKAGAPAGTSLVRVAYSPEGKVKVSGCEDPAILKFAIWVAFSLFAVERKTIPVHASAVVCEGGAVLFLGESGTGKSTHTRLWMRHLNDTWLLNDDSPLVRVDGDGVFAYGSPWSGKTHCYRPEKTPLKAMVRLRQGRHNRIGRLTGPRAIGAVWPSCPPLLACEEELSAPMLGTVGHLVTSVPVYEMECRPDEEAALVAYDAIFNAR